VKLNCKMGRCMKKVENNCPNVFNALWIMPNCPDIVASAETSFSKLKLIKTFNRSHMTDSIDSSLAMLSIEASCLRSLYIWMMS